MTQERTLNLDMPITVKTYDIDFMGIVSNISYVRWMEDLRLKSWRSIIRCRNSWQT